MRKKGIIIATFVFLFAIGAYVLLRFYVLHTKDFKLATAKKENPLDLRPALVAKLQQLVKDGSDGLYLLSVGSLNPDIASSTLDANDVSLSVDSAAFLDLQGRKKLPDDIFRISLKGLHMEGIGIEDLLHKDRIDIKSIDLIEPVIENYHKKQAYNQQERETNEHLTLYQRLMKQMKSIAVGRISVRHGSFLAYAGTKGHPDRHFKDISMLLENILIDSATQHAPNRFLFAKTVTLESKGFSVMSPDSAYVFRIGAVSVSGDQHTIIASNVELRPRLSRAEFVQKLIYRDEMLHLLFPRVVLSGVNWWALLHGEQFIADKAETFNGEFSVYLDKSVPHRPGMEIHNFPSQLLMRVPFPVSIKSLNLHSQRIIYEEFSPKSQKSGIITFDKMETEAEHITNIPSEYKNSPVAFINGKGFFMKSVPLSCSFRFDLSRHRTGDFKVDVHMGAMGYAVVNTFSEPMALLSFPSGQMLRADAHVSGNNSGAKGTIDFRYNDLHIRLLKEKGDELKKKTVTTFIGNLFLVKNQNPGKNGVLRQADFSAVRDHRDNFFSLLWISIKTGLLKTVGIPVKLGVTR